MTKPRRPVKGAGARADMQGTRSLVMNGEIMLYGVVDSYLDPYDPVGAIVRSLDVMGSIIELADQPRLSVRINSPGGNVMEGLSIFNALRNAGKPIDVHIDAMAASIASVIAMAGDTITIADTGTIMIHNPWDVAIGDAEDMRQRADEIDRLKAIVVDIYAKRTGLDPAEIDAMMTAETFMSADDAVARGFADEVEQGLAIAACARLTREDLGRLNAPVSARAARESTVAASAPTMKAAATRVADEPAGDAQSQGAIARVADAVRARMRMRARAADISN
ncbi:ATP-dependent Clp endopeptidase proteolytic subunit ClpP [Methylobacterium sp. OAE515]|uniref:head maturation protease, ClpP-related n=1 Tax=Methylobacterium sp. OAE515 TaxID=2817895 RepID=UPI00178AD906